MGIIIINSVAVIIAFVIGVYIGTLVDKGKKNPLTKIVKKAGVGAKGITAEQEQGHATISYLTDDDEIEMERQEALAEEKKKRYEELDVLARL